MENADVGSEHVQKRTIEVLLVRIVDVGSKIINYFELLFHS